MASPCRAGVDALVICQAGGLSPSASPYLSYLCSAEDSPVISVFHVGGGGGRVDAWNLGPERSLSSAQIPGLS